MQYRIIEATSISTLEGKIEKLINDGWKLQGGISTAIDSRYNTTVYRQAVTKEELHLVNS